MELTSIKSRLINDGRGGRMRMSATFETHCLIYAEERITCGSSIWKTTNKKSSRPIGGSTCYWSRLQVINWWKRVYTVSRCSCLFPRRAWLGLSSEGKNIVNQMDTETKEPEETPTHAYSKCAASLLWLLEAHRR